jgi:antitoxin HicB
VLAYAIELVPDDNDTLLVTCPDLPEVTSFGSDEREAMRHAADAVEAVLVSRISAGEDIPLPSPSSGRRLVQLSALQSARVELYRAMRERRIDRDSLAERLHWQRNTVDRLLDFDRRPSLAELETAFRAVGKRLVVEAVEAA